MSVDTTDVHLVVAYLRELARPVNEDVPAGEMLAHVVERARDPGAALAHVIARGEENGPRQSAALLLFVALGARRAGGVAALGGSAADPRDARRIARSAGPILLEAMRDPAVPDDRKYVIGPLLGLCGVELSPEEYRACFRDFEATVRRNDRETEAALPDTVEGAARALESVDALEWADPDDMIVTEDDWCPCCVADRTNNAATERALELGAELVQAGREDVGAIVLAVGLARAASWSWPVTACERALGAFALARGRAAWLARELAGTRPRGALSGHLLRVAEDLEERGVEPVPPRVGTFTHGYVSGVHHRGERMVVLFYRTDEAGLDAAMFRLSDEVGFEEVRCVFGSAAGLEDEVRAGSPPGMRWAPCTVALARELVADALVQHARSGRWLLPWYFVARAYLGEEPLLPRPRRVNLGPYLLETYVRGPELAEGSESLFDDPVYGGLLFTSSETYEVVEKLERRCKLKRAQTRTARIAAEFASRVPEQERETLVRRLAANLELEALAGRAKRPQNRAAARLYITLTERLVPDGEIGFLRRVREASLARVRENLAKGFQCEEDARRSAKKGAGAEVHGRAYWQVYIRGQDGRGAAGGGR